MAVEIIVDWSHVRGGEVWIDFTVEFSLATSGKYQFTIRGTPYSVHRIVYGVVELSYGN